MTPGEGKIRAAKLPRFHPATVIRDLGDGELPFTIADATSGVAAFGGTGTGKTSGTLRFLALGYMGSAAEMGGLILTSKPSDKAQWLKLAEEAGRLEDVVVFDASGEQRFNFLDWEARQSSAGGGLTINVVALLEEIITALQTNKRTADGDNAFFEDALHQLLTQLVELSQLAGYELRMATMLDILRSAPLSREEAKDAGWQRESACWFFLEKARQRCGQADEDTQADYAECRAYWLDDFANLSEKTRSIITLMFTKLTTAFNMRPLRTLFGKDTTISPEATFDGKIVLVALDTQSYRLAGTISALIWKFCWQVSVMRRKPAPAGEYLRPTFCAADEVAENFLSRSDSAFQAVARESAGCCLYLAQNISQYRKRLGDSDAFESLVANLQTKFFHQNTGPTNQWAAELLGQRWEQVPGINTNTTQPAAQDCGQATSSGVSVNEQHRFLVEPSVFTTLKRGGAAYDYEVEAILYKGGQLFRNSLPYKRVLFRQR